MPELPEILRIGTQMAAALPGKVLCTVTIRQPKCLNVPLEELQQAEGRRVLAVEPLGKWVVVTLDGGLLLLLNLGMGGDLRYFGADAPPPSDAKFQGRFDFADGTGFTIGFWWFGYIHLSSLERLPEHPVGQLGPSPLDTAFTLEYLQGLVGATARNIKSLVTDQKLVAGIGNAYIHDILFLARLHPLAKANRLAAQQVVQLHRAMREGLERVVQQGGLRWERDFYGREGGYQSYLVGYREGQPCPECGTTISKVRTGSTSTYVCPSCQPEPGR